MRVAIADYGAGNLRSLASALVRAGADPVVTVDPAVVRDAPLALIAGVGHVESAAAGLARHGLDDALRDRVAAGRPVAGICVGLQLLFGESEEGGTGLELLAGAGTAPASEAGAAHRLEHRRRDAASALVDGVAGADVYFAHSFAARARRPGGGERDDGSRGPDRRRRRGRDDRRRPVPPRAERRRWCLRPREPAAMVKKRVIPCLDVAGGRVVKGVNFERAPRDGQPVELARRYSELGADELVFLDITATLEGRGPILDVIGRAADELTIPFTAGGGVTGVDDARDLLLAGADKVAINRAAFDDPGILTALAAEFGSQAVVCAIDARAGEVVTHAGRTPRGRAAVEWAREAVERGAGEILLTSIDADGTRAGYDLELHAERRRSGRGSRHRVGWGRRGPAHGGGVRGRRGGRPDRLDRPRATRAAAGVEGRAGGGGMADETLTPVIVQDAETSRVLMLAYANDEALRRTRESGEAWFWSRSRRELWHKGATSGNTMAVEEIRDDCDGDALLYRVRPNGTAAPRAESCFAPWLWRVVAERALAPPSGSYVAGLLATGPAAAAGKVGEEGVEAALAAVTESDERLVEELADLGSTATSSSRRADCSRRRSRTSSRRRHTGA